MQLTLKSPADEKTTEQVLKSFVLRFGDAIEFAIIGNRLVILAPTRKGGSWEVFVFISYL